MLAGDRLVTVGEGEVEVAHEALLREWPRLRAWLERGRRRAAACTATCATAARDWDAGGRDAGELYRGARLAAASGVVRPPTTPELNASERAFLAAEPRGERALAAPPARGARGRRGAARARPSSPASSRSSSAAARATQAIAAEPSAWARARSSRTTSTARCCWRVRAWRSTTRCRRAATCSPRCSRAPPRWASCAATASRSRPSSSAPTSARSPPAPTPTRSPVRHADAAARGHARGRRPATHSSTDLAFSPDGRRLAVGYDCAGRGRRGVRSSAAAVVVARTSPPTAGCSDRTRILARRRGRSTSSSPASSRIRHQGPAVLMRFDARTGAARLGPVPINRAGMHVADDHERRAPPGGRRGRRDRGARCAEPARPDSAGRSAAAAPPQYWPTALAPDDRTVAIGGEDGSVRLLDLETGEQRAALGRHVAEVFGARFTPDGRTLVTTGADGDVILWDVAAATTAARRCPGNPGACSRPRSRATAATLYTAGPGAAVFIWDLAGTRRLGRAVQHRRAQPPSADSPRSRRSGVPRAQLRRPPDRQRSRRWRRQHRRRAHACPTAVRSRSSPTGPVHGLALRAPQPPPGRDRPERLPRTRRRRPRTRDRAPLRPPGDVLPPAISADGRLLVTGSGDEHRPPVVPPGGLRPVGAPLHFDRPASSDVQVSPDGRR